MTREEVEAVPLNSAGYDFMHQQRPCEWEPDAYKAFYEWFQNYGNRLSKHIKWWFVLSREEFDYFLDNPLDKSSKP